MSFGEIDRYDWVRGQNPDLDPRLTAARPDLAWSGLKGKIGAARFSAGKSSTITSPWADLKKTPRPSAPLLTQGLYGEKFRSLEESGGWVFGFLEGDGYTGYIRAAELGSHVIEPTHMVQVPMSHVYSKPDVKTAGPTPLPFSARVALRPGVVKNGFAEAQGLGWVYARHLDEIGNRDRDYLKTARWFLNAPYLWGGRTGLGLDCSALVQLALMRAGIPCPRDTDMQQRELGHSISNVPELSLCKKGDLVFFPGHVGFMASDTHLLHANATHMRVTLEDAEKVVERLKSAHHLSITDIRRLG